MFYISLKFYDKLVEAPRRNPLIMGDSYGLRKSVRLRGIYILNLECIFLKCKKEEKVHRRNRVIYSVDYISTIKKLINFRSRGWGRP